MATSAAAPAAMTSSAVAAAQAAGPHLAAPAASILNQQIQGVFSNDRFFHFVFWVDRRVNSAVNHCEHL